MNNKIIQKIRDFRDDFLPLGNQGLFGILDTMEDFSNDNNGEYSRQPPRYHSRRGYDTQPENLSLTGSEILFLRQAIRQDRQKKQLENQEGTSDSIDSNSKKSRNCTRRF